MKHIGMDVHSTTTDITVLNSNGKKIFHQKIPTRREELVASIKKIPGKKQVVVEESSLSDWITRLLEPYATKIIRCQPQYNRLISESEKKCDEEDSYSLAELSYLDKLKGVHHPTQVYRDLREGVRAYWYSSRQITRAKNRLKAFLLFNGIEKQGKQAYSQRQRSCMLDKIKNSSANMKLATIRYWELDAARQSQLEHLRLLRELAKPVQDKVKILKTIPGVGEIGAHTLVAYLEDGRRIPNKRKLWQYCGIGIRRHESSNKGIEGASRQGNRCLKNALMIAVAHILTGCNGDNALWRIWCSQQAARIDPRRTRRNLARKIAVIAQHLLRSKEPYDDERIIMAH
jgi:transposase